MPLFAGLFTSDHAPVDIVGSAVQVDHGARCLRHEQRAVAQAGHLPRQRIDMAILQAHRRFAVAQCIEYILRIFAAAMRRGDQYRHLRIGMENQFEGRLNHLSKLNRIGAFTRGNGRRHRPILSVCYRQVKGLSYQ